jgi:hypothetical protein
MSTRLRLAFVAAFLPFAAIAEPPEPPGLSCTVTQQRLADGMSLEVRFTNESGNEVSLGPGPHLVWYRDAGAEEPMEHTARANRIQNAPLVVPAGSTRVALYAIDPGPMQEMRCNPAPPAAAALYFYQFSQRPRFRCLLRGYALAAHTLRTDCRANPLSGAAAGRP